MTCRILFFSVLKDVVGTAEMAWALDEAQPVGVLFDQLVVKYPLLQAYRPALLMAVNQTYVSAEELVQAGDEVAFMPPVQGG